MSFYYEGRSQVFKPYWDYDFGDGDPRNLYCVTYIEDKDVWYGTHHTSETPSSDFDDGIEMSKEEVDTCRKLIPECDLPRSYT